MSADTLEHKALEAIAGAVPCRWLLPYPDHPHDPECHQPGMCWSVAERILAALEKRFFEIKWAGPGDGP